MNGKCTYYLPTPPDAALGQKCFENSKDLRSTSVKKSAATKKPTSKTHFGNNNKKKKIYFLPLWSMCSSSSLINYICCMERLHTLDNSTSQFTLILSYLMLSVCCEAFDRFGEQRADKQVTASSGEPSQEQCRQMAKSQGRMR